MSGIVRRRRWAATAAVGFLIVATATASASSASTARLTASSAYWRAGGRLIEVWSGEKLWVMKADGTGRRPILYHSAGLGGASLSPSGRMVGITDATSSPPSRARRCAFNRGPCDEGVLVLKRTGGGTIKQFAGELGRRRAFPSRCGHRMRAPSPWRALLTRHGSSSGTSVPEYAP